jgi:hypothetical protein
MRSYQERLDDAATAAVAFAEKQAEAQGALQGSSEWARIMRDTLQEIITKRPELEGALAGIMAALNVHLGATVTLISLTNTELERMESAMRALNALTGSTGKTMGELFGSGSIPGAAAGGRFGTGQIFTTGEEGPELMKVMPGGVEVLSNPQSRHVLGAGGFDQEAFFARLERTLAARGMPVAEELHVHGATPSEVLDELGWLLHIGSR